MGQNDLKKRFADADAEHKVALKKYHEDPENVTLNNEFKQLSNKRDAAYKIFERAEIKAYEQYTDGNPPYYRTTSFGLSRVDTNIQDDVLDAIKKATGAFSKLRSSDIESIVLKMIDDDFKETEQNFKSEMNKIDEMKTQIYKQQNSIKAKYRLSELEAERSRLYNEITGNSEKIMKREELKDFRAKMASAGSVQKIKRELAELRKEKA